MKTIVLYKSKSGFTKQYTDILKDKVQCDVFDIDLFKGNLNDYENIVFGGSLHMVGIIKLKKFKEMIRGLDKFIFIFAVGATPPHENDIATVKKQNFTEEELLKYHFVYARGGFDFDKLPLIDKFLMWLLKKKLQIKKNKTNDEVGLLHSYSHPLNFVNEKNIASIIEQVQ
jgi:flavodoxin